jgi:hypothetical protein
MLQLDLLAPIAMFQTNPASRPHGSKDLSELQEQKRLIDADSNLLLGLIRQKNLVHLGPLFQQRLRTVHKGIGTVRMLS